MSNVRDILGISDITDSAIDMEYVAHMISQSALSPIPDVGPQTSKKLGWGKGNAGALRFSRSGTVKLTYTSKVYRSGGKNGCKNIMMVKNNLDSPGRLDELMTGNNSRRVDYISREKAAIEPAPEYLLEDKNRPIQMYKEGETKMVGREEAKALLEDGSTFSFVLSPEDSGANLSEVAKDFMLEACKHFNGPMKGWVSANHYNTAHPHVHIICSRTNPENGEELYIRMNYLKTNGMQKSLIKVLNHVMGYRSVLDQQYIDSMKKVEPDKVTERDEEIRQLSVLHDDGFLHLLNSLSECDKEKKASLRRRLWYLQKRQLAEYIKGEWKIRQDYIEALTLSQLKNCFETTEGTEGNVCKLLSSSADKDQYELIGIEEIDESDDKFACMYRSKSDLNDSVLYFSQSDINDSVVMDEDFASLLSRGGRKRE